MVPTVLLFPVLFSAVHCIRRSFLCILGYRPVIEAEWEWVPAQTIAKLATWIRSGKFLKIEYQDIDGTTKKGLFKFSQPEPEVFTYRRHGTAVWKNVKLKMTAQEVISND